MMRIVFLFLMVMSFIGVVNAQQNKMPTPDEVAKKNVEDLDKKLKLNSTQKSVIYSFTFAQAKEQQELFKKQEKYGYNEQDVDKFYKLQNETSKNIRNVLKDKQQIQYDRIVEDRLSGKVEKSKKKKKGEEEETPSDIKGLLSGPPVEKQN